MSTLTSIKCLCQSFSVFFVFEHKLNNFIAIDTIKQTIKFLMKCTKLTGEQFDVRRVCMRINSTKFIAHC